ncbi:MAG: Bug family tripartite tricarboxylate transporter substrate binding protein [Betaproteobacteria bacterium]|mgnify:CR=1 FL=1
MKYIIAFLAVLISAAAVSPVHAQSGYPSRPIRLIVPLAAGGPSDILARSMAQQLSELMKQTVLVDNRAGAGGVIGTDIAAKSPGDGYTMLLLAVATYSINAGRYAKLPYDPIKDLKPVSILAGAPYVLVTHPALPVHTLKELVALDKKRPGQLNYSSGGAGTGPHLATEVLKAATGMTAVHVAYKGAGPAMNDLVAGQVQFQLANMIASLPLVKAGRLRGIAISGSKRSRALPDLPTIAESGVSGLDEVGGHMILVPGSTPQPIVARLHQELLKVLQQPDVKSRLEGEGAEIFGTSPEQSALLIRAEIERMAKLIKQLGLQAE